MLLAATLSLALTTAPLIDAIKQKDAASVRTLLQKHADVNAPEADGATPLHWAAYEDEAELVDLLLAAGAKANVANELGVTPLFLAAANGNAAIVEKLLASGARADAASETGVTPLMQAARSGNPDAVRALVAAGADVDAKERDRDQTALMWAVARRHPVVVKILLEQHAGVHARTRVRPLRVMLDRGPRRSVKTSRQDATEIQAGGTTALLFAAQVGDAESARLLLSAGANVNDTAPDGNSALAVATFAGHSDVARMLIEAGADPNAAGAGYSPLHAAALRGDLATVKALLAKGADPNARLTRGSPVRRFGSQWALPTTMLGATPLMIAATFLEVDIMRALVAGGADPGIGLVNRTTPLLAAAGAAIEHETRPSDLVRWNVIDSDNPVVPRDEARIVDAVTLLLDAGVDVNQINETRDSALHAAAGAGQTKVIQLLADRGAKLDLRNANGQTPLAMTTPRGRQPQAAPGLKAAEELLRKLGARE